VSAHDVLDERATGGAPLLPGKLTPQMAARNRPFGRGSSIGAFGHFPSFLRDSETQPKPVFQAGGRG